MPRKQGVETKSLPSTVFRYGALPPVAGSAEAEEQFRAAHRYRNTLTEIQIMRLACSTDWLRQIAPDYADADTEYQAAEADIDAIYDEIGAVRQKARQLVPLSPEAEARLKAAKAARKAASIRRGVAKQALLYRLSPDLAKCEPEYKRRIEGLSAKEVKARLADDSDLERLRRRADAARKLANAEIYGEVSAAFNDISKIARAATPCYWGTYLTVEEAMEKSVQSGGAPQFKAWRGEGKLGVQIQSTKPLTVEGLLACQDNRLRLEKIVGAPTKHYRLWMRIGSDDKRQPIWCVMPICLHRPMPLGADIANCFIVRRRVATDERYFVNFVLKQSGGWAKETAPEGIVAVDIGYRMVKGGLRVAYWKADDGQEGQLLLQDGSDGRMRLARIGGGKKKKRRFVLVPDDRLAQYDNYAHLRSRRDGEFNAIKEKFAAWIEKQTDLPEWLRERLSGKRHNRTGEVDGYVDGWLASHQTAGWLRSWMVAWGERRGAEKTAASVKQRQTLRQWRSSARLAALVVNWRDNRFAGDEEIFAALEAWRRHDKHLYLWQEHERRSFLDWRKHTYREFAASLRKRYKTVVLENIDLRELAKKPKPDEKAKDGAVTHHRTIAALSELVGALKQSGMAVKLREAAYTTMRCSVCGHVSQWSDAARGRLFVTCDGCGRTVDQDVNACENLLSSGGVASK